MPASLDHIRPDTPMGANLVADGATFRVWAPPAHAVHVLGDFNQRRRTDASLLTVDAAGHWPPLDGLNQSAALTLPANSLLVFAR